MVDLVEQIKELDKIYDSINEKWGQEVAALINSGIGVNSKKYEKELKKINKMYADMASDVLLDRDDLYNELLKEREEEYLSQFQDPEREEELPKVDENGRPVGKKWVDGQWVDINRKK